MKQMSSSFITNFLLVQVNIKVQKHSLSMTGIESPIALMSCVTKPNFFLNFLVSDFLESYPEILKHLPETKKKIPTNFHKQTHLSHTQENWDCG